MYRPCTLITILAAVGSFSGNSQEHKQEYPVNFGLTRSQPEATLPNSSAPAQRVERHNKIEVTTRLDNVSDKVWKLADGWEMVESDMVVREGGNIFDKDFNTSSWYNAVVPGTVLTTLVEAGVYPDPFYGLNNLAIPDDLCRKEWWYRTKFDAPEAAKEKVWLILDGINYMADIWLNGNKLGSMAGAFVEGRYDITDYISDVNVLAVKIYPPHNPGIPHEQSAKAGVGPNGGQLCFDGPTFICSEGWDWLPGIRDRNIGIWQDVYLKYTDEVTVRNPKIVTDLPLPSLDYADIILSLDVVNHSDNSKIVTLNCKIGEGVSFEFPVSLEPLEIKTLHLTPQEIPALRMECPKLWCPNGYGDQNMYTLQVSVKNGEELSDSIAIPFGVRELSYELSVATQEGEELRVDYSPTNDRQNGVIPFSSVPEYQTSEAGTVIARLLPGADISKLNVIPRDSASPYLVVKCNGQRIFCRGGNWGMDDGLKRVSRERLEPAFRLHKDAGFNMIRNWTGESTEELFYTLCDEYGMLVWNDFWLSTEGVNQNVNDEELFINNARETVKRFRNHPSIAVWCPRNEGYAPTSLNNALVEIVTAEDGTRHYNPNSRYMNLRTSGPWHHLENVDDYYINRARGFSTEVGAPSLPTAESMEKFIPESERWPISDTWYYHDLHRGLPEYCNAIDNQFGPSDSMAEFCKKAQIVNYDRYRAIFESWNYHMWDSTTGVLLWMSHPAWPSVEWQTYSWDFETPGAYFGSKKGCEQFHIQRNPNEGSVSVLNTSLTELKDAKARASRWDLKGNLLWSDEVEIKNVSVNSKKDVMALPPSDHGMIILERLELLTSDGTVRINDYLENPSCRFGELNSLPQINLTAKLLRSNENQRVFEVCNPCETMAISLKFNVRRNDTGTAVLPAYFSDGYINLLPGEKRCLEVECDDFIGTSLFVEGYNIEKQKILDL